MEGEAAIAEEVRTLRQQIAQNGDRLRALAKEREKQMRKVALGEAYPTRLKETGRGYRRHNN